MKITAEDVKAQARALGFNFAGIIPAEPASTLDAYFRWIEAGMHGNMGYLARPDRQERRQDLNVILPGVQSMILVGLDYRTLPIPESVLSDPARGRIASYAWGLDYHDIMTPRLQDLADWLSANLAYGTSKVYVDTGAVLERAHAQQAGMGFIGKNTMLIHPRRGSYFFLGEILTDVAFDAYDSPGRQSMCGTCTRCLVACPTDAFPQSFVLDARKCISYLTIENKGWIDRKLRPYMGNWVFGCDICQDVCPWQRFAVPTEEQTFYPKDYDRAAPPLSNLLNMDTQSFKQMFSGTPIERIKRHRMVRNACVAAGNWASPEVLPMLEPLLEDESPLVRGHAAWAYQRVQGDAADRRLKTRYKHETNEEVRDELRLLLAQS